MFYLITLHALLLIALATSAIGGYCILQGKRIFDLKLSTRNFMYVGACSAMSFSFIGAIVCVESLVTPWWNFLLAAILCIVGVFATAHISIDLSDRLRILKRGPSS